MALVELKKRPTAKHLANRRVSFAATGEVDHIREEDDVSLIVATKSGQTYVNMTGKQFLKSLVHRSAKDGTKLLILEF